MLTAEELGRPPTEGAQQCATFAWIAHTGRRLDIRMEWIFHVPNGGDRDRVIAGRLKSQGVRAGVWDICIPIPCGKWHGAWIEMKKPDLYNPDKPGAGLSKEQKAFGMAMHRSGYYTQVCYTWRSAAVAICQYLEIRANDIGVD